MHIKILFFTVVSSNIHKFAIIARINFPLNICNKLKTPIYTNFQTGSKFRQYNAKSHTFVHIVNKTSKVFYVTHKIT